LSLAARNRLDDLDRIAVRDHARFEFSATYDPVIARYSDA